MKNFQKIKRCKRTISYKIENFSSGFALLFVVILSSIILSIAIGIANIALKEVNFSTSAKDTNDAFFAADVGAECALFYNKNIRIDDDFLPAVDCNDTGSGPVSVTPDTSNPDIPFWSFTLSSLGSNNSGGFGQGCASVTITKNRIGNQRAIPPIPPYTKIISRGYNIASGSNCTPLSRSVQRELDVTY